MSASSHDTGHPIAFDGTVWRYVDSGAVVNHERACSACGLACVVQTVTVPAELSHTGQAREKQAGIDACIAPIVKALNDAGLLTVACCCGHSHRPGSIILADGREVIIAPDFETARRIDNLFPTDIHGERVADEITPRRLDDSSTRLAGRPGVQEAHTEAPSQEGVDETPADGQGQPQAEPALVHEVCICAAVKIGDLVVRGHRHGDCLTTAGAIPGVSRDDVRSGVQGFVTSRNRFVDRREAMRLQRAAGVKSCYSRDGELRGEILFSEDLY